MTTPNISIDEQAEAFKRLLMGHGSKVQFWNGSYWSDGDDSPAFSLDHETFIRLKPTPKPPVYRPWTAGEVPVGMVVRQTNRKAWLETIQSKNDRMPALSIAGWVALDVLFRNYEQLDGSPCGVVTEGEK